MLYIILLNTIRLLIFLNKIIEILYKISKRSFAHSIITIFKKFI